MGFAQARTLTIVLGLLLAATRVSSGRLPQNSTASPPAGPPYTIAVDATLVNVDILVTDDRGRVLNGLRRGNFRILDNGIPQQVESFSPTTAPITIVLLLEYSSSSYSYFATRSAAWADRFLDHIEPRDWVALITYDMRPTVRVDFTHNRIAVRDALYSGGPPAFSEANLFDALIDTIDKLDHVRGRKAVLLMSTGFNSFSAASYDDVLKRLKQTDATIFSVGLAEPESLYSSGPNVSYAQAKSWLDAFAQKTGGLSFFPRFEGELPDIFRSVAGFLRSEYTLTFRPPPESRDGRFHRVTVEIIGPDGKPLKVTDEKGKQRKIRVYSREGYTAKAM